MPCIQFGHLVAKVFHCKFFRFKENLTSLWIRISVQVGQPPLHKLVALLEKKQKNSDLKNPFSCVVDAFPLLLAFHFQQDMTQLFRGWSKKTQVLLLLVLHLQQQLGGHVLARQMGENGPFFLQRLQPAASAAHLSSLSER